MSILHVEMTWSAFCEINCLAENPAALFDSLFLFQSCKRCQTQPQNNNINNNSQKKNFLNPQQI